MSSEVENIELKGKENNTDKLNLSGQTARQPISHEFLTIYKHPMHRKLLSKTLFTLHIRNVSFCVWDTYDGEELSWLFTTLHLSSPSSFFLKTHHISNGSVIYYDQLQPSKMTELCNKVKSGEEWQALFTSHNPSVYRGFRGICEEWRVKSRVGFFSRKPTPPATRKHLPNRNYSPLEIYMTYTDIDRHIYG